MGTNYYLRYNICECCDRYDELHIGKSSGGWQFSFQAHNFLDFKLSSLFLENKIAGEDGALKISSYKDWITVFERSIPLRMAKILDEYGVEYSIEDFKELVLLKNSKNKEGLSPLNHYDYCFSDPNINTHNWAKDNWKDDEGYSFSLSDFS